MAFGNIRYKGDDNMKKYLYYRELGYSPETAVLLSKLTYGNEDLSSLLETLGPDDTLRRLCDWLRERPEDDAQEAVRNWFVSTKWPAMKDLFGGVLPISPNAPGGVSGQTIPVFSSNKPDNAEETGRTNLVLDESFPPVLPNRSESMPEMPVVDSGSAGDGALMPGILAMPYGGPNFGLSTPPASPSVMDGQTIQLFGDWGSDSYERIEEKSAKDVFHAPTSTFRMTTNTASMGMVMNQIRSGRRVDLSQVRVEEILNYFDYQTEEATEEKFRISTELLDKGGNKKILYINAQARNEVKPQQNIVLLLDTSSSMSSCRETTQEAIATIISKLRSGDTFSIVTYGSTDQVVLDGYQVSGDGDLDKLAAVILGIVITGFTNGSAGIERAYEIGAKHYREDASNQVILITDGDLNFGITEKNGLEKLIEEKKKSNLFLSVIGSGLWNYKDDKLEALAKHGNGTYCVVNNLSDVNESINRRFISLTNIVAKDVKAQVEFNPKYVKSYRLLGYENRELSHSDFTNDQVISEPYGSGGHGVALYELEMTEGTPETDLKYLQPVLNDSDELCTVKLRYKEPLSDKSCEIVYPVLMAETPVRNAQLAYLLYCLSEKLRQSDKLDDYDREYLQIMLNSELYKNYAAENGEKLEMFVKAAL